MGIIFIILGIFFYVMVIRGIYWVFFGEGNFFDRIKAVSLVSLALYILIVCIFGLGYLWDDEKRIYGQFLIAYDLLTLILINNSDEMWFREMMPKNKVSNSVLQSGYFLIPLVWAYASGWGAYAMPTMIVIIQMIFLPFIMLFEG